MKKFSAILMMMTLFGCMAHQTELRNNQDDYSNRKYEFVPIQNIVTQPDEEIQAIQSLETSVINPDDVIQKDENMDLIAKKLRKELRATGIQVKDVFGQIDLIIPNKVAFGNNQIKFQKKFEESLSDIAKLLKENEQTMIQIIGYTDNMNPILLSKEISLNKANAVADYLRSAGIAPNRIITDGAGEDNPIGNNAKKEGREQNNRIEMTLISLQ